MIQIKSLKDISFKKYQEFYKIKDSISDEDLPYFLITHFYGLSRQEVGEMDPEVYEDKLESLITAVSEQVPFHNVISYNNVLYGFVPKFEDIKTAELLDLETLVKEEDYEHIMSILYRPVVGGVNKLGEYNIEPYKGYDDTFVGISAFHIETWLQVFTKSYLILKDLTLTSSQKEMKMKN
jgi:hypothetical protein